MRVYDARKTLTLVNRQKGRNTREFSTLSLVVLVLKSQDNNNNTKVELFSTFSLNSYNFEFSTTRKLSAFSVVHYTPILHAYTPILHTYTYRTRLSKIPGWRLSYRPILQTYLTSLTYRPILPAYLRCLPYTPTPTHLRLHTYTYLWTQRILVLAPT